MKTIHYALILDRSGSMQDIRKVTVSSFNEQISVIQKLQKDFPEQPLTFTLTLFNDEISEIHTRADASVIQPMELKDYVPDGTTSLLDAIGLTVNKLQSALTADFANNQAEAIVVILTDGHENSSKKYDLKTISGLIKELEATGNWKFNYLGATLDAVDVAATMNINANFSFAFDKMDTHKVYSRINDSMTNYLHRRRKDPNSKWDLPDTDKSN